MQINGYRDIVVNSKYGHTTMRGTMESLFPKIYIFSNVIDTWSDLLNHQENERDVNSSPYRLFLNVDMTVSLYFIMV